MELKSPKINKISIYKKYMYIIKPPTTNLHNT